MTKKSKETYFWSKQKGESLKQYAAFKVYCNHGRMQSEVVKRCKVHKTTVHNWHKKFKWDQRALAYLKAHQEMDKPKVPDPPKEDPYFVRPPRRFNLQTEFDFKRPMQSLFKSELEIYLRYKKAGSTILDQVEQGNISVLQFNEIKLLKLLQDQGRNIQNFLANLDVIVDNGDTEQESKLEKLSIEELEVLREIHKKLAS
jgi:hypothetical protein